jgi:hypothetical protein
VQLVGEAADVVEALSEDPGVLVDLVEQQSLHRRLLAMGWCIWSVGHHRSYL